MDADDQLPEIGSWNGLVFTWYKKVKKVLRHFTTDKTSAPVSPIVVPVGEKFMRGSATSMGWKRTGSLYFERRNGRLFIALVPGGEWRSVPDLALMVIQPLAHSIEQLQSKKPLYIGEPGKQRDRKATEGERQIYLVLSLLSLGRTQHEIAAILGIGCKEMERLMVEIEEVVRDVRDLGLREQVDLDRMCDKLNHTWLAHCNPELAKHLRVGKKRSSTVGEYAEEMKPEPHPDFSSAGLETEPENANSDVTD